MTIRQTSNLSNCVAKRNTRIKAHNRIVTALKKPFFTFMALAIIGVLLPQSVMAQDFLSKKEKTKKIEQYVHNQMQESLIPGVSLVIVEKGNIAYQNGFGFADAAAKKPVTSETLFELASTSKAFTGLAILQLEKEGMLKRTDSVTTFIPWLQLSYNDRPVSITIQDLLYHTSGISAASIQHYPKSNADDALEQTVRTLLNQPLNREPGSSYEYATINYDILGLVIEKVTKQSYEAYMQQHILQPLGMTDSKVGVQQIPPANMATGYRLKFTVPTAHTPAIYRGNTPAGYIISNANDIAKWMNVQLGNVQLQGIDQQLIVDSHTPDRSVKPFDEHTYYGAGWAAQQGDSNVVYHAGVNPTFSSYITLLPEEQIGVAVLSNINSSSTTTIAQGVMDIWNGEAPEANSQPDGMLVVEQIATYVFILVGILGLVGLILIVVCMKKLIRQQRNWTALKGKRLLWFVVHFLLCTAIMFLIVNLPSVLLGGMSWSFVARWAPVTIMFTIYSLIATLSVYFIYGLMLVLSKKQSDLQKELKY
ncbi:beta-lactamase family protein [Paenibacillus sp. SC116]|uniref:serine hydrolase domain-containing protein n=1 Tax=Paenibacillus sp. SC116 TaxID=2968986 RepID=UPI00215A76FF|nr:serine hydrolase domain-containing protein [Paenibacillus sp. SC116]MCR8842305.1 beta-lactamase family protein [Paenibacillus sp. SC116]